IEVTRLLSFHLASSDTVYSTRRPSGEMRGEDTCTRSIASSIVMARFDCAVGDELATASSSHEDTTARSQVEDERMRDLESMQPPASRDRSTIISAWTKTSRS